jgi:hypothetical protein
MLLAWDFFWQQTESRLNPDGKHKKYGMRLGVERYLIYQTTIAKKISVYESVLLVHVYVVQISLHVYVNICLDVDML